MDGFIGIHNNKLVRRFAQPSPPTGAIADIHPEYYLILPRVFNENIQNKFDEWVYTLKTSTVKSEFTASGIQEAGVKLDMLKMTPEERKAYERFQEVKVNEESIIDTAVAKKETEMNAKIVDMIKNMAADGMNAATIAKYAKLTAEEIEKTLKQ